MKPAFCGRGGKETELLCTTAAPEDNVRKRHDADVPFFSSDYFACASASAARLNSSFT